MLTTDKLAETVDSINRRDLLNCTRDLLAHLAGYTDQRTLMKTAKTNSTAVKKVRTDWSQEEVERERKPPQALTKMHFRN
jgi:hypothetical protein